MSTRIPLLLSLLACAPLVSMAQDTPPPPAASPAPSAAMHPSAGGIGLSADEKAKLTTARLTAMQDPDVKSAEQKEQDAAEKLRMAMIADNSALKPALDKLKQAVATPPGTPGRPELTQDERQQVMAERDKMKDTPEAKAMLQAVLDYRAAMRAALIKADPTLSPVLDRIDAAMKAASAMHAPQ